LRARQMEPGSNLLPEVFRRNHAEPDCRKPR
jgi:hypothetical protein